MNQDFGVDLVGLRGRRLASQIFVTYIFQIHIRCIQGGMPVCYILKGFLPEPEVRRLGSVQNLFGIWEDCIVLALLG